MRRPAWILGLLLAAASWLYFHRLGALSLTTDEIYHAIAARSILASGLPVLPNGSLYLKALPFSYLGAGLAAIAGSIEVGVRMASGLSTLLAGIAIYRLTAQLVHARAGLLASALFLFHPWTIEFARWGRLYVLAAALLMLAALHWVRFAETGARREAFLASAWLAAAIVTYPFSVWGAFAIGVCWIVQRMHVRPERTRATLAGVFALTALAAVSIVIIDHNVRALIRATGFYSTFSLDEFTGFSALFARFYFTDLLLFSASTVVLLGHTVVARRAMPRARLLAVIGLLVLTLGGVALVSFVHLQQSAYRYLFPIFAVTIVTAVMAWSLAIDRLEHKRANMVYAGLAVLALAGYGAYGAYGIPLKQHGDRYLNPSFAPSPARTHYMNSAGSARYMRSRAAKGDVLITSQPQFFFFYAGREADYTFRLNYWWPKREPYYFMSRTLVLNKIGGLQKVLQQASARGHRVWIAVNDPKSIGAIEKARKRLKLQRVWRDVEDERTVIYATRAR